MTTQEYYNIVPDSSGWRINPNNCCKIHLGKDANISPNAIIGNYVRIGDNAIIGDNAKIGNSTTIGNHTNVSSDAIIGNYADIGNYVSIGDNSIINDGVRIGDGSKIDDGAKIGTRAILGNHVQLGHCATIGNYATIGNDVIINNNAIIGNDTTIGNYARINAYQTTEELNKYFISTYPNKFIAWKWVTKEFMSPCWGHSTPIKYEIGKIVTASHAVINDIQCSIGLHVFRVGIRPEFVGLCSPSTSKNLICLEVEVNRNNICFGGLPGNSDKIRVKKLKVLRRIPNLFTITS